MRRAENRCVRARRSVQYVLDGARSARGRQHRRRGNPGRPASARRGRCRQLAPGRHGRRRARGGGGVLSRDAARARDFAAWARGHGTRAEAARGELDPDIAINATPAGLKDSDPLPLDPESAARLHAALDLVYAPGGTRWVRTLIAAGVRAQDGREVLVHQGAAAFSRFFPEQAAPLEVMRAAVNRALGA